MEKTPIKATVTMDREFHRKCVIISAIEGISLTKFINKCAKHYINDIGYDMGNLNCLGSRDKN